MTPPPPPESIDLSTQRSSKLLLRPGMLQGGVNYTVKMQAIPVENPTAAAMATAQLRVRAKGVRAKSAVDKASYPQGKAVRLDASLSQDKDNTGAPLTVSYNDIEKLILLKMFE